VQKKEKDRELHENVLNVQDPCFFWEAQTCGMPTARTGAEPHTILLTAAVIPFII
jgi:hypothetical protein